jgi:solute carrier family 50 (sugar transporter)
MAMVMANTELLLKVVLPCVGVCFSTIQLAVPFATVLECRKQGTIGPLNPVPWVSSFIYCSGWVVYSAMIKDVFILCSVTCGVLLNFYATTTALTLLGAHQQALQAAREVEFVGLCGIATWLVVALLVGTATVEGDAAKQVAGSVCLVQGVFYYFSPISSVAKVIRERDASSLSLPLLVLNAAASGTWTMYGYAIDDPFVLGLNTFALFVSLAFVLTKLVLPSRHPEPSALKFVGDAVKDTLRCRQLSGGAPLSVFAKSICGSNSADVSDVVFVGVGTAVTEEKKEKEQEHEEEDSTDTPLPIPRYHDGDGDTGDAAAAAASLSPRRDSRCRSASLSLRLCREVSPHEPFSV